MAQNEDHNKQIIENSIRYLHKLSEMKELNLPALKSFYRTRSRLLEKRNQITLKNKKRLTKCEKCFMQFAEGDAKYEIKPNKLSKFAKSVVGKVEKNGKLTNYQSNYHKKLLKKCMDTRKNKMIITCGFCNNPTLTYINKPIIKPKTIHTPTPVKSKKPKQKKKDKFCGLNKQAVLESSTKKQKPQPEIEIITVDDTDDEKTIRRNRSFETAEFIPLETTKPKKKKKAVQPPVLKVKKVVKANVKLLNKARDKLDGKLKKAAEKKSITSKSKLSSFLSSL